MLKATFLLSLAFLLSLKTNSQTLHVGPGQTYSNLVSAAENATPGDTIFLHEHIYQGGNFITELKGTSDEWIYILAVSGEEVIFQGSTEAIHFIDAEYVYVNGIIVEQQTGNGINADDGGNYETPTHHLIFENCTFRNMASNGNNDLLKLSGLDDFEIRNCQFLNGANGGSGIDMVGCHRGLIKGNYFENMGSNSIQAKGGSQHVRIEANFFLDGGQRTLNLGGSTGLMYFRPDTAHFEAADLQVYSNVFVGSWAAVAYVGSVNVEIINNTIYKPENWVIRILQETVDPDRFLECGDNTFRNNIVYLGDNLSTETNIGPNTRPETFTFSNNLWYNYENSNWPGPNIPVNDPDNIIGEDPLFGNGPEFDFSLQSSSPAIGMGYSVQQPELDFAGALFNSPPSIGAFEGSPLTAVSQASGKEELDLLVFPNPIQNGADLTLQFFNLQKGNIRAELIDIQGRVVEVFYKNEFKKGNLAWSVPLTVRQSGLYFLRVTFNDAKNYFLSRKISKIEILRDKK